MIPIHRRYFIFLFSFLFLGCQQKSDNENQGLAFTIEGRLEHKISGSIVLSALETGDFVPRDTATINNKGEFTFRGEIPNPDIFRISMTGDKAILVVIDVPHLRITGDANDLARTWDVSGSPESILLRQLLQLGQDFESDKARIEKRFIAARSEGRSDSLFFYQEKFLELNDDYNLSIKAFIRRHPHSFTGPYAAYTILQADKEPEFLDSMLMTFNERNPASKYVQLLNERRRVLNPIAVGDMAPEIVLPQPEGTSLKLSSLRGHYVLLDFWASWCRPCRQENPQVVKVYNRFKDKGFEILGISLDESKEQWLAAIEKDKLPWRHVSDLQGGGSVAARLYKVEAIPMTVLVDRDGRIKALNLRGRGLEEKLVELLGE